MTDDGPVWEVFVQEKAGDAHRHAGSVHAHDAEQALENARDVYARRGRPASIWVVPMTAITATAPGDDGPFFQSGDDKPYRLPQHYPTPALDRKHA